MATINTRVVPDAGLDLMDNQTRGFCKDAGEFDGPAWGITTTIDVPTAVARGGVEQITAFLNQQLAGGGAAVHFDIQIKEHETIDPQFAPDWIYADSLGTDELAGIFRKRGHSPNVIWADEQCGDETCEEFRRIALPGEELITTDELNLIPLGQWRIRRPLAPGMKLKHRDPNETHEKIIVIVAAQYDWQQFGARSVIIVYQVAEGEDAGTECVVSNISDIDFFRFVERE